MFDEQISKLPPEPPRSTALLPGLALSASVSKQYLFPLVFLSMFALLPLLIMSTDSKSRLSMRGKTTDAQITSVIEQGDDRLISYAFTPPGAPEYRGSCRCSKTSPYYGVQPGQHVPVRYVPSEPSINQLAEVSKSKDPPLFVFFFFPFFGMMIFIPILAPHFSELFRARRLFKTGRISKGIVVFVKRKNSPSWPTYAMGPSVISIAYRLPSGQEAEGKALCSNEWLIHHLPPGASVNIAFRPEKPTEVVLLDAYIR